MQLSFFSSFSRHFLSLQKIFINQIYLSLITVIMYWELCILFFSQGLCFQCHFQLSLPQYHIGLLFRHHMLFFFVTATSLGDVVYSKTCLDREHEPWRIRTAGCFFFFFNSLFVRDPHGITASTLAVRGGHVYLAVKIGLYKKQQNAFDSSGANMQC